MRILGTPLKTSKHSPVGLKWSPKKPEPPPKDAPNPANRAAANAPGPSRLPARESGPNLDHMAMTEKSLPPLPHEMRASPEASASSAPHGTAPWLNDQESHRGSVPWLHRPDRPPRYSPVEDPHGAFLHPRSSSASMSPGELRDTEAFWNEMDRFIERKLGPGDDFDMQDLLRATSNPQEFGPLLNQHPLARGSGDARPGPSSLPQEWMNAPTPSTSHTPSAPGPSALPPQAAPHRSASPTPSEKEEAADTVGSMNPAEMRAMWKQQRKDASEAKRLGGQDPRA